MACEGQLMRRLPLANESSHLWLGFWKPGARRGPSPATKHPGAGLSLAMGHDHYLWSAAAGAQGKGDLHPLLATFSVPATTTSATTTARNLACLRCKSRRSEWLSMPNVGLTAAFAVPRQQTRGSSSRVGHSFATGEGHLRAPILWHGVRPA